MLLSLVFVCFSPIPLVFLWISLWFTHVSLVFLLLNICSLFFLSFHWFSLVCLRFSCVSPCLVGFFCFLSILSLVFHWFSLLSCWSFFGFSIVYCGVHCFFLVFPVYFLILNSCSFVVFWLSVFLFIGFSVVFFGFPFFSLVFSGFWRHSKLKNQNLESRSAL